jgi:hypothetical protein
MADPLVCEVLEISADVRLVVAAAIRTEQGLQRRLGPWVVEEIGRALGLEAAERRLAIALAGYLAQRDATGRIRAYADVSTAGIEGRPVSPEWFEGLTPGEVHALAIHRQLDRELRSSLH